MEYIRPTVKVYDIDAEQVIASSNQIKIDNNGINDGNIGDFDILGRDDLPKSNNNIWDSSW